MTNETITQFLYVKIIVNNNDVTGKMIINKEIPEENAFKEFTKYVKYNSIIIDVGSCYGQYALICSRLAFNGLVIAIEPNPYHFELLIKGIKLNNIKNIIPLNIALSDYKGTSKLFMCNNHIEGGTLFKDKLKQELNCEPDKEIDINVNTLDNILKELNIDYDTIDMIKIDAEGAEPKIIKGMKNVLTQSKNVILLAEYATHAITASSENSKNFVEYLINRFKKVKIITEDKPAKITILNKNNIDKYININCTSLFCQ